MTKVAFEWPTPPYFNFTHDRDVKGSETCLIYMRDGTKILGELIQVSTGSSKHCIFIHP